MLMKKYFIINHINVMIKITHAIFYNKGLGLKKLIRYLNK